MTATDFDLPEQQARRQIDALLQAAGWQVQRRRDMNLGAGPGVAVRELQTGAGPADYALFLAEPHRIVAEVDRRLTALDAVDAAIDAGLAKCGRLRQAILKSAFEGRLVEQEPNDEPVGALHHGSEQGAPDTLVPLGIKAGSQ